ncbi:hypothetical protein [Tateyamaria sp. Alg231-49]|uniref:hypothetical protein n=1 Tax=Tateyamaria sp. Alg231-49 TaxID=1922219 RepID=UPI00131F3771|nr:hypothetical protein [Tateyamaria sp. Alg231-49]
MTDKEDGKDFWDKFEIGGKVALPVVVALAALYLNDQVSQREVSGRMIELSISVLASDPIYDEGEARVDPLRDWAVNVLRHPDNPPTLSRGAATELRRLGLPDEGRIQAYSSEEYIQLWQRWDDLAYGPTGFYDRQSCIELMRSGPRDISLERIEWFCSAVFDLGVTRPRELIEGTQEDEAKE